MKRSLFLIFFFYIIFLSYSIYPAEKDNTHFIVGAKIPMHLNISQYSPIIPIEGLGAGIGIGPYIEVIPFPFIAFETDFYIRTFTLGDDVVYNEFNVPVVGKIRFPLSSNFAVSIGGGIIYCIPFSGNVLLTVADAAPIPIPETDLISAFGLIAKLGFQVRVDRSFINIDLGVEHVNKPINIQQTDFVLSMGLGIGLF